MHTFLIYRDTKNFINLSRAKFLHRGDGCKQMDIIVFSIFVALALALSYIHISKKFPVAGAVAGGIFIFLGLSIMINPLTSASCHAVVLNKTISGNVTTYANDILCGTADLTNSSLASYMKELFGFALIFLGLSQILLMHTDVKR